MTDHPLPQWQVPHSNTCAVTEQRANLWDEFMAEMITRRGDPPQELMRVLIEYDGGGDREREACTCGKYPREPKSGVPQGTYLSVQARALAQHIAAFNDLVSRDTGTHDGEPRGPLWDEGPSLPSGREIKLWATYLNDLADLWDFG